MTTDDAATALERMLVAIDSGGTSAATIDDVAPVAAGEQLRHDTVQETCRAHTCASCPIADDSPFHTSLRPCRHYCRIEIARSKPFALEFLHMNRNYSKQDAKDYARENRRGISAARRVRDSLNPVREAMTRSGSADKPQAFGKYWQELLGQVGGHVRPPMLELTAN